MLAAMNTAHPTDRNWLGRALTLFFRLNADLMNYTPLSHRARRAARLMPLLVAAMDARV